MTDLRIADYEDYINALPDDSPEKHDYFIDHLDTEPRDESYLEACETNEKVYEAQCYETARENQL